MPSTSRKQARTMAAATHNPAFAKKVGIPTKVAKEFNRADMVDKPSGVKGSMGGGAKKARTAGLGMVKKS